MLRPLKSMSTLALSPGLFPATMATLAFLLAPIGTQAEQGRKSKSATDAAEQAQAIVLKARRIESELDQETRAEGDVELQRGELTVRANRLSYTQIDGKVSAHGQVSIERDGNLFRGPDLQLQVQAFEGSFLTPTYFFSRTGAGGKAERIDFLDAQHGRAIGGSYSSCRPDDAAATPAWVLNTRSLDLDFEANEGIADGAVLHFYGVPILAVPRLSFPLGGQRKSGWLPPSLGLDSRSGVDLGIPYYWNIAPQRDATLMPRLISRRGVGLDSEFRYLTPITEGELTLNILPNDRIMQDKRWAWRMHQHGVAPLDWRYQIDAERVSDDVYWKDFPQGIKSPTPRLLATDLRSSRNFASRLGELQLYGRLQHWQVLQDLDPTAVIASPYQRSPQLGARWQSDLPGQMTAGLTLEYNRFDLPREASPQSLPTGSRVHALGHFGWSAGNAGWWFRPQLSFNAANYQLDQAASARIDTRSRVVPTLSIDQGWVLERKTSYFGHALLQTLEPRLFYVNTPYRSQLTLPNFDSAAKDFNFDSIYTENAFSGVDRVSDAHQLTLGAISRMSAPDSGEELLRLGLVQRVLLRNQLITPEGTPYTQKLSDLLLLGSVHLNPRWWADGAIEYNPNLGRTVRSVMSLRYSPGPFRTLNATYRFARGQSEQAELGWQWPLTGSTAGSSAEAAVRKAASGASCAGAWYSVGRVLYSMQDRRLTDSLVGFEYDAGCWIGRVVVERLSTGRAEANTRWLFQLELVGLGRLGNNPLNVLRDNIPGYRLLRDDRATSNKASYD
jgi:LPS-assembly protein